MPRLTNLMFLDRLPMPSLRMYVVASLGVFLAVLSHVHRTVTSDEDWRQELDARLAQSGFSNLSKELVNQSAAVQMLYYSLTDQTCIWVLLNSLCCLTVVIGCCVKCFAFGKLRISEEQNARDHVCNFLFHKAIFLFGVLNAQYFDEWVVWSCWFIMVGFFYILINLCHDRFQFMSSSPGPASARLWRIFSFLLFCFFCSLALLGASVLVALRFSVNYGGFLAADALLLGLSALFGLCRYGVQVRNLRRQGADWERRHAFLYYSELIFEVIILCVDFGHHIHMLVWSNIFLSMASLVLCMQLRYLFQEVDRRLKRHRNYRRIIQHMDQNFPLVKVSEVGGDDTCAICWDTLLTARKLSCGHVFHNWCLKGWLEQDGSCPTCRNRLELGRPADGVDVPNPVPAAPVRRRRRFSHFFHFDGGRYARWLPSFSVEVSHNMGTAHIFRTVPPSNSQLNSMAERVREMFPHLPMEQVVEDLQETNSVELTVENVLEGRLLREARVSEGSQDSEDFDSDEDSQDSLEGSSMMSEGDALSAPPSPDTPSSSSPLWSNSSPDAGSRFSKSSSERELMLEDRKETLIAENRRRYLATEQAADLRQTHPELFPAAM